jgi:hypothetical protein
MAPRLRSSARKVKREAALETGLPVNARGLPTFPVELLLEILSHASEDSIPIPNKIAKPLPPKYLERTNTLRTLSQLCRSLRNVALPALWEKIEAWATTSEYPLHTLYKRTGWQKDIATDLVSQLETVTIRAPSLASYVRYVCVIYLIYRSQDLNLHRVVNVLITPHSADTVLIELARCMALMKNLHTVQISSYSGFIDLPRRRNIHISELYNAAFAEYRFPSVRRIAFNSPWEIEPLPCFPEARRVYMALFLRPSEHEDWNHWVLHQVKQLASHYPNVQVFKWDAERYRPWDVANGRSHLRLHD